MRLPAPHGPPRRRPERVRGRGAAANPRNRSERIDIDFEPGESTAERGDAPPTELFRDDSKTVLSRNDSPDLGFQYSLNPYRGCEHGCIYCYARPTHEYLGFSAGLDFESRILVKERAPELLRRALENPRWTPQVIMLSGVTDPYQPIERRLRVTRRCLEVLAEFRNPVAIVTKNHMVTRDSTCSWSSTGSRPAPSTCRSHRCRRRSRHAWSPGLRVHGGGWKRCAN